MKFTSLSERVSGAGADAWEIHYAAIKRQRQGDEVIILSIGQETVESTPDVVIDSAIDSIKSGRHHYSDIGGEIELREMIAKRASAQLGCVIAPTNIAVMSGAQNALFATSLCVLESGDEAIIIDPYYATYPATFSAGGAKIIPVPTCAETEFMPSADDIIEQVTERTRAIVVNSPHNPSGVVYSRDFMTKMVEICLANDIWLISDEVYAFFADPGTFHSPASIPGAFHCCITVSSVSKSHRMTGWRVGWAIAREEIIERMFNLSMCMSYGLPMITQDAAVTALANSSEIEAKARADINRKRNEVISLLSQINGVTIRGSHVGMFVVFDIRDLPVSDNEFAWKLLNEYDVAVLPCTAFGASGKGILRINIGESENNLRTACKRIRQLIDTL